MMHIIRVFRIAGISLILPGLLLSSCSSFLSPRSRQILRDPDWQKNLSTYTYLPGDIQVSASLYEKEIGRSALTSLKLILTRLNISLGKDKRGTVLVRLTLEEKGYIKDFRKQNTLSLLIELVDGEEKSLGAYYFCTDSEDSFVSSTYLYNQLERGINGLFQ